MDFDDSGSEGPSTSNPTDNPDSTTTVSRATANTFHSTTSTTFEAVGLILRPRAPGRPLPFRTSENAKDVLDVLGPLIRDMRLFPQLLENVNNNRETIESAVAKIAAQTIKMKKELPGLREKVKKLKSLLNMEEYNKWVGFFEDMCGKCEIEELFKELLPMKSSSDLQAQQDKILKLNTRMLVSLQYPFVCFAFLNDRGDLRKKGVDRMGRPAKLRHRPNNNFNLDGTGPSSSMSSQRTSKLTGKDKIPQQNKIGSGNFKHSASRLRQPVNISGKQEEHVDDIPMNVDDSEDLMTDGEPKTAEKERIMKANIFQTFSMIMSVARTSLGPEDREKVKETLFKLTGLEEETFQINEIKVEKFEEFDSDNYRNLNEFFKHNTDPKVKTAFTDRRTEEQGRMYSKERLTGTNFEDLAEGSREMMKQKAEESVKKEDNLLYDARTTPELPNLPTSYHEEELERFKKVHGYIGHEGLKGTDRLRSPAMHIKADKEIMKTTGFRDFITNTPLTCTDDFLQSQGIKPELFNWKNLMKRGSNVKIDIIQQFPQRTDEIINPEVGSLSENTDREQIPKCVKSINARFKVTLKQYATYMDQILKICKEGIETLLQDGATEANFFEIMDSLIDVKLEENTKGSKGKSGNKEKKDTRRILWVYFGTNVDLGRTSRSGKKTFKEQVDAFKQLYDWLSPFAKETLYKYLPGLSIDGITDLQMYVKPPNARTHVHMENSGLGSINVNIGMDDCIWGSVAYEYAAAVEEFVKKMFADEKASIYVDYWLLEKALRDAGIPVQVTRQRSGAMVHVAYGTFHWVHSLGFCKNVSWNIAQPTLTQLRVMGLNQDHMMWDGESIRVPTMLIVVGMAKEKAFANDAKMSQLVLFYLSRIIACCEIEHNMLPPGTETVLMTEEELESLQLASYSCCWICQNVPTYLIPIHRGTLYCVRDKPEEANVYVRFVLEDLYAIRDAYVQAAQPAVFPAAANVQDIEPAVDVMMSDEGMDGGQPVEQMEVDQNVESVQPEE